MRVRTRDPMTGNDVLDRVRAPFVIEGQGTGALEIYFESERSRQRYLEIPVRRPQACSLTLYREIADDETILWD